MCVPLVSGDGLLYLTSVMPPHHCSAPLFPHHDLRHYWTLHQRSSRLVRVQCRCPLHKSVESVHIQILHDINGRVFQFNGNQSLDITQQRRCLRLEGSKGGYDGVVTWLVLDESVELL